MKTKFCNFSRRLLASGAFVIAVSASPGALAENSQLELIPSDTHFYFGTGKPIAVKDFFAMVPDMFKPESLAGILPDVADSPTRQQMLTQISEFLSDPAKVTEQWGLGDELQFSAYTVGILPVFRIAGDDKKFADAISKLETEKEIEFDKLTHKGIDVRILAPEDDDASASKVVAPSDEEIKQAEANLTKATDASAAAREKLETATANLDTAKQTNDASGIAAAANEIAAAASNISEAQSMQSETEDALAELIDAKTAAEKLQLSGGKSGPGLVVAADGKDLVFAFSSNAYDPDLLDQLLGLSKPASSLQASGKLKAIRKEWGYGDELAMFVDFVVLADTFTGGDGEGAKQLKALASDIPEMDDFLPLMASDPCQAEIRQLAKNWPMMVSGNRRFEVKDDRIAIEGHMAILVEHEELRNTLKLLRGVVPVSQSNSDAIVSYGIGFDVDSLPKLSTQVTSLIGNVSYDCELLSALGKISATDISPLTMGAMMFSGMARGIKGFSMNLYDAEIDPQSNHMPVKNVDAAIAIAAEDPGLLLQTLRMLPQTSMLAELPLDGSAMSLNDALPVPLPEGVEIFAAVKGKNIVIYSGSQAENFASRVGGNGNEGFILSTINTKKLMDKIETVMADAPAEMLEHEDFSALMAAMKAYPVGNIFYKIDFTDRGIELESVSDIEAPER